MKSVTPLFTILFLCALTGYSQPARNLIAIGGEAGYPVYAYESNEAIGLGINIKGEHFFGPRFSALATIGYTAYRGNLVYWDGTEDKNFALVPVLIGARFFVQKFYAELESGVAAKASENANTAIAIAPAVGFMSKKLDLAIRFFAVPVTPSIPENTFLEKGGYSYLTLRFYYNLN